MSIVRFYWTCAIAQQGAFILFQGERLSSFPHYRYDSIRIDRNAKAKLRNDLRLYFGIHTGSIYPEEFNLVNEMIRKSERVSSDPFSLDNELKLIFHNIEKLTEHYLNELEVATGDKYQAIIDEVEEELLDFHLRMKNFLDGLQKTNPENPQYKDNCPQWKAQFNGLIEKFANEAESLMRAYPKFAIQISRRELLL